MAAKKRNRPSTGNPVGRPPLFKTPEELEEKISLYFSDCPDKKKVFFEGIEKEIPSPTISGLALYLGFCDRHSMWDYEFGRPEFSNTIKRARAKITQYYENKMDGGQCTGPLFMLKNLGYKDEQKVEHGGEVKVTQMGTIKLSTGKGMVFNVG